MAAPGLLLDRPKALLCLLAEGEERVKQKDLGDGVYGFEYYPMVPGTYTVTITWGGQNIGRR